jgi:hypothetical protein
VTYQREGKGMRSSRTARSEPQKDQDSFSSATDIPKDVKENILLLAEKTISNHETFEVEKFAQEGKTVGPPSSQQKIPQRRGRLRKNKEIVKSRITEESRIRSIVEELLRCAIRLEHIGDLSQKNKNRERRADVIGENEKAPSQQLKQSKLAIAELYQENMELRRQLVTKATKAPTTQGPEGNVAWLKR